ncbi:hypothetical protein [Lysobacter capsici]|uniref:hypothetical protein n=1 Tax=Lysobacter capsici TaxID=435897 RepID=UPI000AA4CB1E|nr:hypothetical protein [Lysobacter capsici]
MRAALRACYCIASYKPRRAKAMQKLSFNGNGNGNGNGNSNSNSNSNSKSPALERRNDFGVSRGACPLCQRGQ